MGTGPSCGPVFFAYMEGHSGRPALSWHSYVPVHRRYVAGGMEKVRPGTGREAGLGHAGSDVFTLPHSQVNDRRERCPGKPCMYSQELPCCNFIRMKSLWGT